MERRTITPQERDRQLDGSRRIAPGIWEDAEGHVHWSVPEILAFFDLTDTVENREQVIKTLREVHREVHGEGSDRNIIVQDVES